ncbi:MAG: FMN-binding glutamate synthase family protein [Alphaproteobacteria bacterium]|nr:FMN-binding glutamate synthase family protein [Alphaproteobacteria bacterium]
MVPGISFIELIFWLPYALVQNPVLTLLGLFVLVAALMALKDFLQRENPIKRNFPLVAMGRYALSNMGAPMRQYLFANDRDERPIPRYIRRWIEASAHNEDATVPFGTQLDLDRPGSVLMRHSAFPRMQYEEPPRVRVGADTPNPYEVARFNVSAMSFGSLGRNAVLSLNKGAAAGGYYHNTGEGGISPYHIQPGGDLVWQLGTAKFGARRKDGSFDPELFKSRASHPNVKMIEVKLSQGAKPGKGGILPKEKITAEIAEIRNVERGHDVISPPRHQEWEDAEGMCRFIAQVQELSGKPVGVKFCLGHPSFLDEICQAFIKTGIYPAYIAVDGAEGGTGAAPLAHTDLLGYPMLDAVMLTENKLIEYGLRDRIKICASGKVFTGGLLAVALAAGADWAASARGFMLSIGCIQALHCNTNFCPSGVATHNKWLQRGVVPDVQGDHAAHYQHAVIKEFAMILAACGKDHPDELTRDDIMKVVDWHRIRPMSELVPYAEEREDLAELRERLAAKAASPTAPAGP